MNDSLLKRNLEQSTKNQEFTEENFTEIHSMVDELLASLQKTKKEKVKVKLPRSRKKWENKSKKGKKTEDVKIRELPFTF